MRLRPFMFNIVPRGASVVQYRTTLDAVCMSFGVVDLNFADEPRKPDDMKRKLLLCVLLMLTLAVSAQQETMNEVVSRALTVAHQQALGMAKSLEGRDGVVPKNFDGKRVHVAGYRSWICGFYPGLLWLLYEDRPTKELQRYADMYTRRIEPCKNMRNTHDLGFMINCSFGNGYRLTRDAHYLDVMKTAAGSLASRYNKKVGALRSWDAKKWQFPVIIDNMMNLELLTDVSRLTGDNTYRNMAVSHARKTQLNHFRADYSSYHVVSYDTVSGRAIQKVTHQGLADSSAWARGQAWALYGFTMMYRETGRKEFLEQARHIGHYLVSHPRMPEDGIPYWDFDDPKIPDTYRDASAGAVMASAFIELSQIDKSADAALWLAFGEKQVRSLASPAYMAEPGTNGNFILKHSVGNYRKHSEMDVPLTYADYYFVEALLRLKKVVTQRAGLQDREYWLKMMTRIARPVLENLSKDQLKTVMPFESSSKDIRRRKSSYLEAFGRTICGIAPWLELGADDTDEGKLRADFISMAQKGLRNAVDPNAKDSMMFSGYHQPLVDAGFLAEGLLRAPNKLFRELDTETQDLVVNALKRSRSIRPNQSNWLMFTATVEAALLELTGTCDTTRLLWGVKRFMTDGWYKGDAVYGDGAEVHVDYYNSLVIHPMLTDVLTVIKKHGLPAQKYYDQQILRHSRLAAELERFISPEGTYPCVGRSITYRCGVFHGLSAAALLNILPEKVKPAQVRSAMTAVLRRQFANPDNFDADGWLRVGFNGSQPAMGEKYINTGSEYMCMAFFVAMGLPADAPFWSDPFAEWTSVKAWGGQKMMADHALRDAKMFANEGSR